MPIPSEIQDLIDRLNRELAETETDATQGLNLVRPILSRFPDNARMIQFFAFFNNALFFVEISRRRIQTTIERLEATDVTAADIQEGGEDLGSLLGQVLETKIAVRDINASLE
ncbi:hypothetical protein [Argonema galeatum]|uniref:hypothetical protein n=1 Tax=Argonema galeatum TaxID=2942762 RepID=UPI002011FBC2|nr:hypothetical protein [Argonema galeatum]MCL1468136.1 hypothetical protein [Argonema galeatum A003/A1]